MEIRDAVEADAERLAALTGAPTDVMRNLVHDRTVRVAAEPPADLDGDTDPAEEGTDSRHEHAGATEESGDGDHEADDREADDREAEDYETDGHAADVATGDAPGGDTDTEADDTDREAVRGFVSFDARASTVHVTQLEGDPGTCERLLEEPRRFAAGEGMSVELLVPEGEDGTRTAAERAGFEDRGSGPRFGGTPTIRYRWEPDG